MKKKALREQIGYTVLFLSVILINSSINGFRIMGGIEQLSLLYCLDYSLGFCSRFLIGSIMKLFFPVLTIRHLDILTLVINLLLDIAIAGLFAYILSKAKKENRFVAGFVIAFVLTSSYGIYQFMAMRGFLEVYTFIVALLCLLCLRRPYLRWAIPFLCFIGLSIHYIFLIMFIPLIFSLMLYEVAKQPDKKTIGVFASAFGVSFFSSIYYVVFANRTLKVNYEQMVAYIHQRMPTIELFDKYIIYYYFTDEIANVSEYAAPKNVFEYLTFTFSVVKDAVLSNNDKVMLLLFLALILICMLLQSVWIINYRKHRQKQTQNTALRLVYLLNCLLPFIWLLLFILSMDYERFFGIIFCNYFMMLLYYIYDENEDLLGTLRSVVSAARKRPYLLFLAAAVLCTLRLIGG